MTTLRVQQINNDLGETLFDDELRQKRNFILLRGTFRFGREFMRKVAWWEAHWERHGSDVERFKKVFLEAFDTDEFDYNRVLYRFLNWRMFPPMNRHEMCIELPPCPESWM